MPLKQFRAVGIMSLTRFARICGHNKTKLEIYYIRKNYRGRERYEIEPYEIKDGALYGFDPEAETIKRFLCHGIIAIADTGKPWDVPEDHPRNEWERKLKFDFGKKKLRKKENQGD